MSAWRDPDAAAGAPCALRILFGTLDARLIALDAKTGLACADFGNNGAVDLNEGSRPRDPGDYLVTSPPAMWHNLVITGSAVGDNRAVDNELGIVRAFDARTGALVWTWDPIPRTPDNPVYSDWTDEAAKITGAANAWSVLSLDVERGLLFVPVGSASPDFFGGERTGDNRHANSIVALNAATGAVVWARQLVHHDVWDYDMPAQPVLIDLRAQRPDRFRRWCRRPRWACCSCSTAAPASRCSASRNAPCRRTVSTAKCCRRRSRSRHCRRWYRTVR